MKWYKKIYKLNLFNQIYSPLIIAFYIALYFDANLWTTDNKYALITVTCILFLPIIVLLIINLIFISTINNNELNLNKKLLLIGISIITILSTILTLCFNKYLTNNFNEEFVLSNTLKINSWLVSIYLLIMIIFAIIYSILDHFIKSGSVATDTFSILFVLSIFIFLYEYFVLVFYVINLKNKTHLEKFYMCLPFFNIYLSTY